MPRAFFGPFFRFERKDFSPRGRQPHHPRRSRRVSPRWGLPPAKWTYIGTSMRLSSEQPSRDSHCRACSPKLRVSPITPAPTSESVSIPHDAKNAPVKRYASPMPFTHSSPLPFLYFQNKETPPFHGRQRSFEPIVLYNAFFGQALAHSKHRMHSVPFFRLRELSVISTSMGHTFLHFPQETHLLWSH